VIRLVGAVPADATTHGMPATDLGTEWGMVMAAGSLTLLPVIAFALLVQRHILRGMTLGAVKG
jgi:multiple sugar transport system permease protein